MKLSHFTPLFLLFTLLIISRSAPSEDLVDLSAVPDFNKYTNYTSKIYSGYLPINEHKAHHYVFFESQNDPSNDPLILWLNGGPGCSSLLGMLYEHGPFVYPDGANETIWNIYSWNTNASIIYMESPACVGLSYCDDLQMKFDDYGTAQDNLDALVDWFGKFPEYLPNEFYVMGESYGGIYVPFTAYYIDQYNENTTSSKINLKGFAVGNPVTNYDLEQFGDLYFWSDHGLISPADIQTVKKQCSGSQIDDNFCNKLQDQLYDTLQDINIYDAYRFCWQNNDGDAEERRRIGDGYQTRFKKLYKQQHSSNPSSFGNEPDPGRPPCIDDIGAYYLLNSDGYRNSFHIWANASAQSNHKWFMCSNINYHSNKNASYWIYPKMINKGYKILVYSGDTDGSVPTEGTLAWIGALVKEMNLKVERPYTQWTLPGRNPNEPQVAGYNAVYDGLSFVSVKGVGHMVPQWQRPAGYKMIYAFLNDELLD